MYNSANNVKSRTLKGHSVSRCALHAGNKAQSIAALRSNVEMKGYRAHVS